jgi:uncharacterized protein with HEPN domain
MATSRPRRTFQQILDNVAAIRRFTAGMDETSFKANELVIAAVERCVSRVSEAATRLGDTAANVAPNLPWAQIRKIGNHLRHAYDTVNLDTIWEIVSLDLDALELACNRALATLPPDPP